MCAAALLSPHVGVSNTCCLISDKQQMLRPGVSKQSRGRSMRRDNIMSCERRILSCSSKLMHRSRARGFLVGGTVGGNADVVSMRARGRQEPS